jgi:chromosome segregation ATPase
MKTITLKKLTLDNWRAQSVVLEFKDGVNEIRARNGIGKSTLFNAWVWLICGTDTQDRANYDLYDTKHEQSKDTPAASVEAVLDVDGSEVILKRSAKSQWTRPRGREEWVKASSDKYTFYVDNVEYLAKQYQDHVSSIFAGQDNDMIKMMVNPLQNLNLEWKQLRD